MRRLLHILSALVFLDGLSVYAAEKSFDVGCATWFVGSIVNSSGAIIGRVDSVSRHEDLYSFTIDVSGIAGHVPELEGVKRFSSSTPYQIKTGSWVIVYVHYYEKKPDLATSGREPIVIQDISDPLAQLLMKKGLDWPKYSDKDLNLLKNRLPGEYEDIKESKKYEPGH